MPCCRLCATRDLSGESGLAAIIQSMSEGVAIAVGIGMAAVSVMALALAWFAWRAVSRARTQLRAVSDLLDERVTTVPAASRRLRDALDDVHRQSERSLWGVAAFDERVEGIRSRVMAAHATTKALNKQLADNREHLIRVRNLVPMILRVLEMRRSF